MRAKNITIEAPPLTFLDKIRTTIAKFMPSEKRTEARDNILVLAKISQAISISNTQHKPITKW